jgi:hypothetical protein
MRVPSITETTNETIQEVSKSQMIRALDVLAIGPTMVLVGYRFKAENDFDKFLKLALILFGWSTVYYNGKNYYSNYSRNKKLI